MRGRKERSGAEWKPFAATGGGLGTSRPTTFPLATSASAVSGVCFTGDGVLTSLTGEYVAVEGFSEAETVLLKGNAEVVLDAACLAGLSAGLWSGPDELKADTEGLRRFEPSLSYE